MIIIIDDERTFAFGDIDPSDEVVYLRDSESGLAYLNRVWINQTYTYDDWALKALWLDHDLGEGGDITIIVKWLRLVAQTNMPLEVDHIFVHSQNPPGADNIVRQLKPFYRIDRVPLPDLLEKSQDGQ